MDKMTLNAYQEQAHTTSCHGGEIVYPIAALAEENGEVQSNWADWVRNAEYLNMNWDVVKEKLSDELGDVLWNTAEICTLLDMEFEYLDTYAAARNTNMTISISYYMCQLSSAVGKVSAALSKYIRKNGGKIPTVEEIVSGAAKVKPEKTLKSAIIDGLVLVYHMVDNLIVRMDMDKSQILVNNIRKLADRKQANTLGGVGSVERK